jgi:hypothetical protein
MGQWSEDWQYVLVLAAPTESLGDYHSHFETTRYAVDLLQGPGSRAEALTWWRERQPTGDAVAAIDRWFLVRHAGAQRPELPRRPEVFLGLTPDERRGIWHLIMADIGYDACRHRLHEERKADLQASECRECPVTATFSAPGEEMAALVAAQPWARQPVRPPAVNVSTTRMSTRRRQP